MTLKSHLDNFSQFCSLLGLLQHKSRRFHSNFWEINCELLLFADTFSAGQDTYDDGTNLVMCEPSSRALRLARSGGFWASSARSKLGQRNSVGSSSLRNGRKTVLYGIFLLFCQFEPQKLPCYCLIFTPADAKQSQKPLLINKTACFSKKTGLYKGKVCCHLRLDSARLEAQKLGSPKARWFASSARQKLGNDQARTSLI